MRLAEDLKSRDVLRLNQPKQCSEDARLKRWRVRLAKRESERVRHRERTRRPHPARDLGQHGDRSRHDATALELRLDQADRLVAKRSNGHEEGDVDLVLHEDVRCIWSGAFDQAPWCSDRPHE